MEGIIQSKSKMFLVSCFCFLAGIVVASLFFLVVPRVMLYGATFFFVGIVGMHWREARARAVSVFVCCFFFGIARYGIAFPGDHRGHISFYTNQVVDVYGYVAAEPDIRLDGVRYIIRATQVDDSVVDGRVYVKYTTYPRYEYGDVLQMRCRLERPEPVEDFRYDMFLARFRVFTLCTAPQIKQIGEGHGVLFFRTIFSFKIAVAKKINLLWHEPYASFMAGLLYGYRGGLGTLNELFAVTGVTHIIAISGYNITIIATIFITMCIHLSIPRKKAFWCVTMGIAVFVIFAGASASVVRAGIMGVIVLFAKRLGRSGGVGRVMVCTAVLMCMHNPFVLMWDAGFQLSFISTLGLVYLTPLFETVGKKIPEVFGIKESLISTCAAIIATLPLILYQFGRLSIVAPLVNILILWTLPWIMAVGFVAVGVSTVFPSLAAVISWVAFLGMKYIVVVVSWFAELPFAAVALRVPLWAMLLLYALMGVFVWKKRKGSYEPSQ